MPETEKPPQPSYLPIVPSEVTNRLLQDLGLNKDSAAQPVEIRDRIKSLTSGVFSDLIASNPDFAKDINSLLNERYSLVHSVDSALNGMAIVLKTFDYVKESDLMLRLSSLQPDDLRLAKQTLEDSFPKKDEDVSILQRLLSLPKVPETQVSLNECLKEVKPWSYLAGDTFNEGAAAMYKTLGVLWPKLYPPQAPTQTPPQQPTI